MLSSPVKVSSVMEISTSYTPSSESFKLCSRRVPFSNTRIRSRYSSRRFPMISVPIDWTTVIGFSLLSCHLITGGSRLVLEYRTESRASPPTVPRIRFPKLVMFTPSTPPVQKMVNFNEASFADLTNPDLINNKNQGKESLLLSAPRYFSRHAFLIYSSQLPPTL